MSKNWRKGFFSGKGKWGRGNGKMGMIVPLSFNRRPSRNSVPARPTALSSWGNPRIRTSSRCRTRRSFGGGSECCDGQAKFGTRDLGKRRCIPRGSCFPPWHGGKVCRTFTLPRRGFPFTLCPLTHTKYIFDGVHRTHV